MCIFFNRPLSCKEKSRITGSYKYLAAEKENSCLASTDDADAAAAASTLAKYIKRFRHGSPLSRAEREKQRQGDSEDFWWLNSDHSKLSGPSDTSTPNSDRSKKHMRQKSESGAKLNVRLFYDLFHFDLCQPTEAYRMHVYFLSSSVLQCTLVAFVMNNGRLF